MRALLLERSVSREALCEVGHDNINIMYYAYILKLSDGSYYHGSSNNLKERYKCHENGDVDSTKNLRPIKLVFYAAFISKDKALEFEKYLKSSSGFAFRNKRLV